MGRRGMLTTRLSADALQDCNSHLKALEKLWTQPLGAHRGDIIARLTLVLGHLARAVVGDREHLIQPNGPTHPSALRAIQVMEARLSYPWTLKELADEVNVSSSYLLRVFRSSTGLPPMAYLARRRGETAAELLLHSDDSVSQIGSAVGWPDQNYFARRFKAQFGLSASSYRTRFVHTVRQLQRAPENTMSPDGGGQASRRVGEE
jgi:AraC family L-rhamnose operon transcriptional activator RhaR